MDDSCSGIWNSPAEEGIWEGAGISLSVSLPFAMTETGAVASTLWEVSRSGAAKSIDLDSNISESIPEVDPPVFYMHWISLCIAKWNFYVHT